MPRRTFSIESRELEKEAEECRRRIFEAESRIKPEDLDLEEVLTLKSIYNILDGDFAKASDDLERLISQSRYPDHVSQTIKTAIAVRKMLKERDGMDAFRTALDEEIRKAKWIKALERRKSDTSDARLTLLSRIMEIKGGPQSLVSHPVHEAASKAGFSEERAIHLANHVYHMNDAHPLIALYLLRKKLEKQPQRK